MPHDLKTLDQISNTFWDLIALAQTNRTSFRSALQGMSRDELYRFYWTYRFAAGVLKFEPYVNHFDPDLSDDGIEDVCLWVVGKGKEYYTGIINDPEHTPCDVEEPAPEISRSEVGGG